MAVLREWRALIRRARRDEYVRYVTATGLASYRGTPGNLGASIAVRDVDAERSEIVTLSWWTDTDAIRAFAGDDIGRARYFPEDERFLLTRPEHVHHYEASVPDLTRDEP
jgi:heme-degrading monooxygenase HmoA